MGQVNSEIILYLDGEKQTNKPGHGLREKNHVVSIEAEKLFNKIHASQKGKKKSLSKLRIEMNFISLIRDTEKGFNKI